MIAKTTKRNLKNSLAIATLSILLIIPPVASAAYSKWDLKITNLASETTNIPYESLLTLPKTIVYAELLCYGQPVTSGNWGGVKVSDLLSQTGELDPAVESIYFSAQDGYEVSIPIELALNPNVIVAYEKDNVTLAETLRLVLPSNNGNAWIAMVTSIGMTSEPSGTTLLPSQARTPLDPSLTLSQSQQSTLLKPVPTTTPAPQIPTPTPQPTNAIITPTIAPTVNATQSPTQQTVPNEPKVLALEIVYAATLGTIIALVVAGFAIYLRKRQCNKP